MDTISNETQEASLGREPHVPELPDLERTVKVQGKSALKKTPSLVKKRVSWIDTTGKPLVEVSFVDYYDRRNPFLYSSPHAVPKSKTVLLFMAVVIFSFAAISSVLSL
eukprot:TRINITY_DN3677_c0_g1_i1.p1 TRINITY_DN3677_c0_g1~~TRINITY_DN3677_c0_g1_i1.p1  ORF type:complete len:118 (-),score=18.54 TRINITY_DN3677_c0_g1_i1:9-332(-)